MFKKLCLAALIATMPCSSFVFAIDAIVINDRIVVIQHALAHMAHEREAIVLNLQHTVVMSKKALEHMKTKLQDAYDSLRLRVVAVVTTIAESEEFDYSINKLTDMQLSCIVDDAMRFDDIAYDPADYPINRRIDTELAQAFPVWDENINQLFNIWYVMSANLCGSRLLLEKLALKEAELKAELAALQAETQEISE